ncbi:MAG: Xaa-Pro peptidase family protein [Mycobacteriales bacterium]
MGEHGASTLFPADRLDRAASAADASGLDALLITPGADLRYLTGYHALPLERLTCLVLPARGPAALVVPRLELPRAQESAAGSLGMQIVGWDETEDPYEICASLLRMAVDGEPVAIGVADRMWAVQALRLRDALPAADQRAAGGVLRELRMRKTKDEVEALRAAGAAIDRVHARIGEWLRPGRAEAEVGRDIAAAIVEEGHVQVNFVIVGSGPNGASPHHDTGPRVIERGDAVVVDIGGATAEGYCSDETRTYVVGDAPEGFADYYEVLRQAQQAACEAVRPGVTCASIDAVAREVITAAGYGEYFIHRTGHGIGLEEHEEPYIVAGNEELLEPGMAFSIEPGIYLPGRHGARIEDIVVCTETGHDNLNLVTRELIVIEA